ncbi:MAG: ATP-binding protein [Ardenticatenaceae bacterium]|nr:ATP-binding protein [Ardenticatenaceae bacterium]
MTHYLSQLQKFIWDHYNLAELEQLCFELSVNYDDIRGDGLQDKARELVRWLARRSRLGSLLEQLQENRPLPFQEARLSTVVSDVVFQAYEEEAGALRSHIRIHDFKNLVDERTRYFVGREFVFNAIDDLLAKPHFSSGYIVIQGEPGIGKTAVASQLIKQRGYVHHFNIAGQYIRTVRDFLTNICAQLIVQYELPHLRLSDEATNNSGFLSRLLGEAAAKVEGQPVIILIDALDEAENMGLPPEANCLFLPQVLPPNVYFIVTTRVQADYRLFVDRREDIYIRDDDPHNQDDVRRYIQNFLRLYADEMATRLVTWNVTEEIFIQVLTDKSQGNFMYLVHVLHDIRDGKLTAVNIDNIHDLPQGLRAYYQRHWRIMKTADRVRFETYYEPVVCQLATVREPVSIRDLTTWTELPPSEIKEVIKEWRAFLNEGKNEQGETLYRIYHASFQDFLKEEVNLSKYHDVIAQTALNKIAW